MTDIMKITETAKRLGIKLTNAEEGTEIYECWADRVQWAENVGRLVGGASDDGDHAVADAIREANRYAI